MIGKQSGQKGSNLLEILTALGIIGIVLTIVVGVLFSEVRGTATAKTTVSAYIELGNAGHFLTNDIMMAQSSDLVNESPPTDNLTLSWIEWYELTANPHVSTYWLSGKELKRDYDGVVTTIARNISSVSFSQTDRIITVELASTPPWVPSKTTEQTFRIRLRPLE